MTSFPLWRRADRVSEYHDEGALPALTLDLIEPAFGRIIPHAEIPVQTRPEAGAVLVKPGDVLFGRLRPYLAKSMLVTESAYASTELLALRPHSDLDSQFLAYVVQSKAFVDWTVQTSEGTKMPRTSWDKVGAYGLPAVANAEQRAIAELLDTETARIDALITKKRRLIDLLAERHADAVETAIREAGRVSGEVPLKRAVASITVGIVVTPSAWYAVEGVPALRGLNVEPGMIDPSEMVFLTEEGHRLHRKSALRRGDVVVVRTGQAGAAAVVPQELDGANCIDLLLIRPGEMVPEFLAFVLNSDWTQKHVASNSVGSIQSHFNVGALRELPVPNASDTLQRQLSKDLQGQAAQVSAALEKLTRQITLLQEHRQALITAAVTGELDVPGSAA